MKIRSGFVSNSSSSSFVIVAPKKNVDNVLKEMNEYEQAVVNYIKSEKVFLGIPVNVFCGVSGNMDSWEYGFDVQKWCKKNKIDPDDDDLSTYEVWSSFEKKLKEETSDIISQEQSM